MMIDDFSYFFLLAVSCCCCCCSCSCYFCQKGSLKSNHSQRPIPMAVKVGRTSKLHQKTP